ncbi:MAG: cytochrome c oxidase subunit 3, partial [Bacteroidota bacterium]
PVPDFVFKSLPFLKGEYPLIFVTIMTFVLIVSSVTMVRAVQEGHRENRKGVRYWMVLTIIGGACFLGCQAYEWTALIAHEHMSLTENPFGTHIYDGAYLDEAGNPTDDTFVMGDSYLIHKHEVDGEMVWDKRSFVIYDEAGQITLDEEGNQMVLQEELGPKAFGALFFFITGFHGFHVFSGLVILAIIAMNVASGIYVERRNGYEMVEKVGLYWHFVDLVWVFVFLVFYLL